MQGCLLIPGWWLVVVGSILSIVFWFVFTSPNFINPTTKFEGVLATAALGIVGIGCIIIGAAEYVYPIPCINVVP